MPSIGLIITLYYPSKGIDISLITLYLLPEMVKKQLLTLFIIFSCLAPGLSFVMLHKRKVISTIDMENQGERSLPLIIMFISCALLFILFIYKDPDGYLPKYLMALPLAGAIVMALFLLINRWIKISMHAAGGGILVGYLCAYYLTQTTAPIWIIAMAIIASGLTLSARLYLNKHKPIEVYSGWSLAFLVTFLCNWYYPFL
jgi:membrane-associated phospholipid phosphatase